jgi:hypothetical protein
MADDLGHRTADGAWEWTTPGPDGPITMSHEASDVTTHLYGPGEFNRPIPLYRGPFYTSSDRTPQDRYDGDIRLTWLPQPRIEMRGRRPLRQQDLENFANIAHERGIWQKIPQAFLDDMTRVPPVPSDGVAEWSSQPQTAFLDYTQVYPTDIGDGQNLSRLTALIPNGWPTYPSGFLLCDPADRRRYWNGRAIATARGWRVFIDDLHRDENFWEDLEGQRGYGVTHVLSLSREDGMPFAATDAAAPLLAARLAFSLALGRRADVALPVGWKKDTPVWVRWTAGQVDPYRTSTTWLDKTVVADQISELVGRFIEASRDELRRDTLLYSISYYHQSLSLQEELAVAAAVSGLLLLANSWLVEDLKAFSNGAWNAFNTEKQIRYLLEHCSISCAIPEDFDDLESVASQLAESSPNEARRDGLGCSISLRNNVVHPTRDKRQRWTPYQWAEARMLCTHFLELALLCYVGYQGKYHPRIAMNRWVGHVKNVPWRKDEAESGPSGSTEG